MGDVNNDLQQVQDSLMHISLALNKQMQSVAMARTETASCMVSYR